MFVLVVFIINIFESEAMYQYVLLNQRMRSHLCGTRHCDTQRQIPEEWGLFFTFSTVVTRHHARYTSHSLHCTQRQDHASVN